MKRKTYKVKFLDESLIVDNNWDKEIWNEIEEITLQNYMGVQPEHFPVTKIKLLYDENNLYIIFHVEDRYVKCIAQNHQEAVFKDSCVEFFFSPFNNIGKGYFNLEINCGGTALFSYHKVPRIDRVKISIEDINKIEIAHSLPKIIETEINEPKVWTLEYRLPFSILEKYADIAKPASGKKWWANFYKIADGTSHPHWLTWNKVDFPKPNFHMPEFFGELEFL